MSYYHQNGYRSQEKQYDKPETMGTDHPARLRIDRINILNYTEYYHGGVCFIRSADSAVSHMRRKTFVRGCLSGKEWGSKRYLCMKYLTTGELA